MGWIRGLLKSEHDSGLSHPVFAHDEHSKALIEHVEDVNTRGGSTSEKPAQKAGPPKKYNFQPLIIEDGELPFIPAEEVSSKRQPGALDNAGSRTEAGSNYWIVVDNVVYDCTSFISEHPGGRQVILSFVGEDCSWQFWRFHGRQEMEQYGRELRIGRTKGITNRFSEPVRFVGLNRLGDDEWNP